MTREELVEAVAKDLYPWTFARTNEHRLARDLLAQHAPAIIRLAVNAAEWEVSDEFKPLIAEVLVLAWERGERA